MQIVDGFDSVTIPQKTIYQMPDRAPNTMGLVGHLRRASARIAYIFNNVTNLFIGLYQNSE